MRNYQDLLADILEEGEVKTDRTGVGTYSLFGRTLEFDMKDGFPLMQCKKLPPRFIFEELMWFLRGQIDVDILERLGVTIWREWRLADGTIGPGYGKQFRDFAGVDQLAEFVNGIVNNPNSRRHLITLWNPVDVPKMALPPCHGIVIQAYCHSDGGLSLLMHQRSCDAFLGLPFNIASYAFFLHMLAFVTERTPKRLVITLGDVHIYKNHITQVGELLDRVIYPPLPKLIIDPWFGDPNRRDWFDTASPLEKLTAFTWRDIKIEGYDPLPAIKAPVAV